MLKEQNWQDVRKRKSFYIRNSVHQSDYTNGLAATNTFCYSSSSRLADWTCCFIVAYSLFFTKLHSWLRSLISNMNAHCASCKMHPIAHTTLTLPRVSSSLPGQQLSKITEPAHHLCHLDPTKLNSLGSLVTKASGRPLMPVGPCLPSPHGLTHAEHKMQNKGRHNISFIKVYLIWKWFPFANTGGCKGAS